MCGDILKKIYLGKGKYPTFQMMWCRGYYGEHLRDDFPKAGTHSGGDWEEET